MNGNVHFLSPRLDRDSKNPKVMVAKLFIFLQSKGTVPSPWWIHHTSICDLSQTVGRKLFSTPVRRLSTLVLQMLTKRISGFGSKCVSSQGNLTTDTHKLFIAHEACNALGATDGIAS